MTKTDLSDVYRDYIACLNKQDWGGLTKGEIKYDNALSGGPLRVAMPQNDHFSSVS